MLGLLDRLGLRAFDRAELFRAKGTSTGTASPTWLGGSPGGWGVPCFFTGMKRHDQFATAVETEFFRHSHCYQSRLRRDAHY